MPGPRLRQHCVSPAEEVDQLCDLISTPGLGGGGCPLNGPLRWTEARLAREIGLYNEPRGADWPDRPDPLSIAQQRASLPRMSNTGVKYGRDTTRRGTRPTTTHWDRGQAHAPK